MRCRALYILTIVVVLPLVSGGWSGLNRYSDSVYLCLAQMAEPEPPVYYAIDLITTKKIRGARRATGTGNVTYARSPFGVSISRSGSYVYNLDVQLEKIDKSIDGTLLAWVTTFNLKDIRLLGVLDESLHTSGTVEFNKFIVVITLEPAGQDVGEKWTGPVVLRGMSRSGFMHTKAGHGPFQRENCASYGYS